jgi:winged helix DNA-binding protein
VAERELTTREINRAVLARQLLLQRASLPLARALERVAGLQAQYAPSAYVGLWSRLKDFERGSLTAALHGRRAVQGSLMRSTIHLVSAADYWPFHAGTAAGRRDWFLRVARHQVAADHMERAAAIVGEKLKRGPARATELRRLLAESAVPPIAWAGLGHWLPMLRVPPSGTWERRRADLYGLAEEWLGPPEAGEAEGLRHLVVRYLGAFGPAAIKEIAGWAGLNPAAVTPVLERMELRAFRDLRGSRLLDLPRAPLPDPATPAPVRFLPTWDATLLVHARRSGILPERFRPLVFNTRTPHSVPTFLVDGQVAGTWRYEAGRVRIAPFEGIPRQARRELDQEAAALAAFHTESIGQVVAEAPDSAGS